MTQIIIRIILLLTTALCVFSARGQKKAQSTISFASERDMYAQKIDSLESAYRNCNAEGNTHFRIAREMSELYDKIAVCDVRIELLNFNVEKATPEECSILIRKVAAIIPDDYIQPAILKKAIDNDDYFVLNLCAVLEARQRNYDTALTYLHQAGKHFYKSSDIYIPVYHNLAVIYAIKAINNDSQRNDYIKKSEEYAKEYLRLFDLTTNLKSGSSETYSFNSEFILVDSWLPDRNIYGLTTLRSHIKNMLRDLNTTF